MASSKRVKQGPHQVQSKHEIEKKFFAFLEESGGLSYDLNETKFQNRATNVEVRDGKLVFQMERHAAALGAQYRKGQSMGAFIERNMTYTFDPQTNTLDEQEGESRLVIDDLWWCAEDICFDDSVEVEVSEDGTFIIKAVCTCDEKTVTNYEEAESFIRSIVDGYYLDHYTVDCESFVSKEEIEKLQAALRETCAEIVLDRLESAWKNAGLPIPK